MLLKDINIYYGVLFLLVTLCNRKTVHAYQEKRFSMCNGQSIHSYFFSYIYLETADNGMYPLSGGYMRWLCDGNFDKALSHVLMKWAVFLRF